MSPKLGILAIVALGAAGLGCSDPTAVAKKTYGGRGRVASTNGGAVVLTYDERVAVATNRSAGVISVFHLDPTREPGDVVRRIAKEFDVGVEAKPWAAVIGEDDDTAYVLLRGTQEVVRVTGLHDRPRVDRATAVRVGAEPTDIAITPTGAKLYVANWGEGTVSMIETSNLVAQQYTDLNFALAQTGALGALTEASQLPDSQGVWTDAELRSLRLGLAHPRALAMTDDEDTDDFDETLYVTEFFSQAIPGTTNPDPDQQRQGFVYPISMQSGQALSPIPLSPVDTGFPDAEAGATYCVPNQLYAAAVEGSRLYVTSMCASPRGPVGLGSGDTTVNFRTLVHPAVFVVDTSPTEQREIPSMGGVLTRKLLDAYDANPALTDRRMPLVPNDIAVVSENDVPRAYVTALGADAVFAIDYGSGTPVPSASYINLRPNGRLPLGIVLSRDSNRPFALVLNDDSESLSVISLSEGRRVVEKDAVTGSHAVDEDARDGRKLFTTGLTIWSFQGLAHSSCESCHPEGLSDGIVWRFPRGPRRTISAAGTYFPDGATRRMLLWTANVDEIHDVEVIARGVSGGVGGVLWNSYTGDAVPNKDCRLIYDGSTASPVGGLAACPGPKSTTARLNGLNGALGAITRPEGSPPCPPEAMSCDINTSPDWDRIDAYIRSLRAPRAPGVCARGLRPIGSACLDPDLVAAGRELFRGARARCAGCHGGPGWTVSRVFYTPSLANNGRLPPTKPTVDMLDTGGVMLAEMRGSLRLATYQAGELSVLNPPAASGMATFRSFAPTPDAADANQAALDYLYGSADQINCALRDVGTFPRQEMGADPDMRGIAAPGVLAVEESRRNLVAPPPDAPGGTPATYQTTLSVGKDGFNVPSLVGLALTGPLFHAGNAQTLEEVFISTFEAHHRSAVFAADLELTRDDVRGLVSYLLSIDDDTEVVPVPSSSTGELSFDPDLCAQFTE